MGWDTLNLFARVEVTVTRMDARETFQPPTFMIMPWTADLDLYPGSPRRGRNLLAVLLTTSNRWHLPHVP